MFHMSFQVDMNTSAKTSNSCLLKSCLVELPEMSAVAPTATISLSPLHSVGIPELFATCAPYEMPPDCVCGIQLQDKILCVILHAWPQAITRLCQAAFRVWESCPPHIRLGAWSVHCDFLEVVAVSCEYPAFLDQVPPFAGLFRGSLG